MDIFHKITMDEAVVLDLQPIIEKMKKLRDEELPSLEKYVQVSAWNYQTICQGIPFHK